MENGTHFRFFFIFKFWIVEWNALAVLAFFAAGKKQKARKYNLCKIKMKRKYMMYVNVNKYDKDRSTFTLRNAEFSSYQCY